jgi:hypothetical protein
MSYGINTNAKRDRRIKPRFEIKVEARIQAQLIGSPLKLDFVTENISEGGLLLNYSGRERLTFNAATILETWLFPDEGDPIFFFTKFVRYQSPTTIAIRIIDIDQDAHVRYRKFIETNMSREVD